MSVTGSRNFLGNQRVDVPHLRAVDSSITADFDLLAGNIMAGNRPLVISGFAVLTAGAIGAQATSLQIGVINGVIMHPDAAESGTMYFTPSGRTTETLNSSNARVSGGFTANTVNYIGLDLRRAADDSTADLVQFLDPDTKTEEARTVPLARTLDYIIYVSTQDFASTEGVAPLAKITTDINNNVTFIEDARDLFFRLGSGGVLPDPKFAYPWPGDREEVGDNSDFTVGDKVITNLKDWSNAVMTRLWELGGGSYWYSPTADRNVRMIRSGVTFLNGEWFEWDGTDLHWRGISFLFDNSTAFVNTVTNQLIDSPGLTDLADGEAIYVDVERDTNAAVLIAQKAALISLGTPVIPGSRYIIAWRSGATVYTRDSSFPVGATFFPATDTSLGIVQLTYPAGVLATPEVMPQDAQGAMHNEAFANIVPSDGYGLRGIGFNLGAGIQGFGGNNAATVAIEAYIDTLLLAAVGGVGVIGVGGEDSPGILGLGNDLGSGGTFIGGPGGPAIQTYPADPSAYYKSQVTIRDSQGNMRAGFDHIGFPGGRYTEVREEWVWLSEANTTLDAGTKFNDYPLWSYWLSSGGGAPGVSVGLPDFTAGVNWNYLRLRSASSAGLGTNAGYSKPNMWFFTAPSDMYWVLELPVRVSGVGGADYRIGSGANGGFGTTISLDFDGVFFRKLDGDTNWVAVTDNAGEAGGITTTDTLVPPSLGWQMMRIEFYGSATAIGRTAKFFIDGALVATHTTNIPATLAQSFMASVRYISSQRNLELGPLHLVWSHMLTPFEV